MQIARKCDEQNHDREQRRTGQIPDRRIPKVSDHEFAGLIDELRNLDNLEGWTKQMDGKTDDRIVLYLNCPLEVCEARIMERAKTSGRSDDNIGSL